MGTLHNQPEKDIELNEVTVRLESQHLLIETNDHDAKDAPVLDWITRGKKGAIIHYHEIITMNQLYLFLFTIGVSMDTLFLYIPVINEGKKCITVKNNLKNISLILRSVTDIFFLELILYHFLVMPNRPRSWVCYFNILVEFLAIAPFPQVFILHFFTEVGSKREMIKRTGLNTIIALQYFPRNIRIYLTYLGIKKGSFVSPMAVIFWNLLFFFVLSYIFGSFWYFFAVQRKTSCWLEACKKSEGCVPTSFDCDNSTMTNFTFISNFCSISEPNTSTNSTFSFGIYEEAIRTKLLNKLSFSEKILYSFWWGLRNLSSSGQNLEPSGYVWETLFAALVTTFGLMLFLYFIGQVQVYLEILASPLTKEKWMRMKYRERDVETWLAKNNLNKDEIKKAIMRKIRHMPNIEGVDLKIILSLLPSEEKKSIKSLLCHPTLKKVAALQNVDSKVMEYITTCLNPVTYSENNYIIHEGEPLGFILIITQGVVWSFKTSDGNSNKVNIMGKGYVYGEELIERTLKSVIHGVDPYSDIFISNTNVKAHTKVEAFIIMDTDIRKLVSKFKIPITESLKKSRKEVLNLESSAASIIQRTMRHRFDHNKQSKIAANSKIA